MSRLTRAAGGTPLNSKRVEMVRDRPCADASLVGLERQTRRGHGRPACLLVADVRSEKASAD